MKRLIGAALALAVVLGFSTTAQAKGDPDVPTKAGRYQITTNQTVARPATKSFVRAADPDMPVGPNQPRVLVMAKSGDPDVPTISGWLYWFASLRAAIMR